MSQVRVIVQDVKQDVVYMVEAVANKPKYGSVTFLSGTFRYLPFNSCGEIVMEQTIEGDIDRLTSFAERTPERFIEWVRDRLGLTPQTPVAKTINHVYSNA